MAAPVTKLSDSMDLDYALALDAPAGEHTIAVRVFDDGDTSAWKNGGEVGPGRTLRAYSHSMVPGGLCVRS
jgi:hypothetical protein